MGHESVVRMLIDRGADIHATEELELTSLHRACERGNESVVTMLIDSGAHLNVADVRGQTPLHVACERDHESVVRMLIDRGADVNVAGHVAGLGWTPLYMACGGGERSGTVATILIDSGANVNVPAEDGCTPLHQACSYCSETIATVLIDRGADVNAADKRGCTPLHTACSSILKFRYRDELHEIIRVLILAGIDTQARDSQGRLPVELLESDDEESIAIYQESVVEVDRQVLRPVLK
jgi:ankyrin repeat protein